MAITELDESAALVVIDLQKGILARSTVHPAGEVVSRAAELASAFRERGLPVVLVNVTGHRPVRTEKSLGGGSLPADWAQLVPELDQQPSDFLVTKQSADAFIDTPLDGYLRGRKVTQIFMAGIATSLGVESTARSAFDHGYNVVFVVDAMTDRDAGTHRNSIEKIFPLLGETGTTEEVLKLLAS